MLTINTPLSGANKSWSICTYNPVFIRMIFLHFMQMMLSVFPTSFFLSFFASSSFASFSPHGIFPKILLFLYFLYYTFLSSDPCFCFFLSQAQRTEDQRNQENFSEAGKINLKERSSIYTSRFTSQNYQVEIRVNTVWAFTHETVRN